MLHGYRKRKKPFSLRTDVITYTLMWLQSWRKSTKGQASKIFALSKWYILFQYKPFRMSSAMEFKSKEGSDCLEPSELWINDERQMRWAGCFQSFVDPNSFPLRHGSVLRCKSKERQWLPYAGFDLNSKMISLKKLTFLTRTSGTVQRKDESKGNGVWLWIVNKTKFCIRVHNW